MWPKITKITSQNYKNHFPKLQILNLKTIEFAPKSAIKK